MAKVDDIEEFVETEATGLARYVRDNPLAMVAGVMILGMLVARFAFLGNPKATP